MGVDVMWAEPPDRVWKRPKEVGLELTWLAVEFALPLTEDVEFVVTVAVVLEVRSVVDVSVVDVSETTVVVLDTLLPVMGSDAIAELLELLASDEAARCASS